MAPSPQPNGYLNTVLNTPPRAGHSVAPTFSATQRSLQARNKDFGAVGKKEESYEVRQRREEAARILESAEMLIWWSSARNQSIPQTRQHFQNIVLGIEEVDADVAWREEWEVEERERSALASPRSAKGKEREKRRVSSGVQHA